MCWLVGILFAPVCCVLGEASRWVRRMDGFCLANLLLPPPVLRKREWTAHHFGRGTSAENDRLCRGKQVTRVLWLRLRAKRVIIDTLFGVWCFGICYEGTCVRPVNKARGTRPDIFKCVVVDKFSLAVRHDRVLPNSLLEKIKGLGFCDRAHVEARIVCVRGFSWMLLRLLRCRCSSSLSEAFLCSLA